MSKLVCDRCGSQDMIEDKETGEIICASCGLVVSRVKLVRRGFSEDETPSTRSVSLTPAERRKMDRLMTIDKRLRADEEDPYVLRLATIEIQRLIQTLHLPESIEASAESIYRRAQKEGLVPRGTINGFAAASVYAACRVQGLPRTLRQVDEASSEDIKDISRMYRILLTELNLSVETDNPLKHVTHLARAVGLSHSVEQLASDILIEVMHVNHHTGKSPEGLAASALYIACKELKAKCTQEALGEAAGVSRLTIRKRVNGIKKNIDLEKILG